jgi:multidrug efflux pump
MIWNFCIRRPVFTVVIFLFFTIFGIYSFFQLPVRENPDIDFPIVSVNVALPGADPEVIETEVIDPLEEEINTIEGLKTLSSTAREGVGVITAEFELWRDIDVATQDVRDRVERVRRELPEGIEAPIVRKIDPDARAIMWISLTGDERWDAVRLTSYADEIIKERIENLRGVGQILIGGERLYAVRVRLEPARLAAHQVTVQDVVETIRRNNVQIPSGRIESTEREFLIKTKGQFSSPGPLNDLIILERNGRPIRIRDVGEAVDGVENERQLARFVGEMSVGLGVVRQRDANTVAVANLVRERMVRLARDFPPGLAYTVASDESVYIEQNINDLLLTILFAAILVMLVVLFFLRSLRGTFITGLAIPTSLLGGFSVIYLFGFSLNVLTLLGFILAIGIVIDDSIVVLESNYRQMEAGEEAVNAARVGTSEVAFPSIANTLALAAVFIPVAFTAGLIGRFFLEFALTVAVTVIFSTFTALTLTPMLCSRLLQVPEKRGGVYLWAERAIVQVETAFELALKSALAHRLVAILVGLLFLAAGFFFFQRLTTDFLPVADRSEFFLTFETPEGSTLQSTDRYARGLEEVLLGTPEISHYFLAIGLSRGGGPGRVNAGISFVRLVPPRERERTQEVIVQELRGKFAQVPGGIAFPINPTLGPATGAPLQIVIQHPDLDELDRVQEDVMNWMRQSPDYVGVNTDLKMNRPQIEVAIHRDKASQMGVSVTDIGNTLRFLFGDTEISEIERQNKRYAIIPEAIGRGQMVPAMLAHLYVRGGGGDLVAMDNLVDAEETIGPSEIHHFNRLRAATLSASTPPGVPLGEALDNLEAHLGQTLPEGFEYALTGQAQDFRESFYYLTIALIFAVVFVYLVLCAQFESFVHPFTILMSIPLAGVGAFLLLWILGMTFNIYSFIGIIMLTGMASKNAILLIDYSNVLVKRGRTVVEAAREAARVRFRPVVMTTLSTVLGMMPIAFGFGAGGETRAPLGVAVAGGLLATTGLTLVFIPLVYTLVDRLQKMALGRKKGRKGQGEMAV